MVSVPRINNSWQSPVCNPTFTLTSVKELPMSWIWSHRARAKAYSAGESRLEVLEVQQCHLKKRGTYRRQPMPVTTVSITIILQLVVIDGLTNATPALGFQETMTVLSLLCARVFGKFWHFDHYFSSHIQEGRGGKGGLCIQGATQPLLWPCGRWQHCHSQFALQSTVTFFLFPSPGLPGKQPNGKTFLPCRNWGTNNI